VVEDSGGDFEVVLPVVDAVAAGQRWVPGTEMELRRAQG
jgi:hypothetical protein